MLSTACCGHQALTTILSPSFQRSVPWSSVLPEKRTALCRILWKKPWCLSCVPGAHPLTVPLGCSIHRRPLAKSVRPMIVVGAWEFLTSRCGGFPGPVRMERVVKGTGSGCTSCTKVARSRLRFGNRVVKLVTRPWVLGHCPITMNRLVPSSIPQNLLGISRRMSEMSLHCSSVCRHSRADVARLARSSTSYSFSSSWTRRRDMFARAVSQGSYMCSGCKVQRDQRERGGHQDQGDRCSKTHDIPFSGHAAETKSLRIIDDMRQSNYKLRSRTCISIETATQVAGVPVQDVHHRGGSKTTTS